MSGQYRWIGLGFAALVCVAGASLLFLAGGGPGEEQVRAALGERLPAYWSVRSIDVSVSSKSDDEDSPVYRQRFEATVAPKEDLYVAAYSEGSIGPFMVVKRTSGPAKEYKLHGVATSTSKHDGWATELVLDNSVDGLGIPRSGFSEPVVVAGSDHAARIETELKSARKLAEMVANATRATSGSAVTR